MFSIDNGLNILYSDKPVSDAVNFGSESALLNLADSKEWSREHLEGIWNSFAGCAPFAELKPTKKFKNRPYAVRMIWSAIQRLAPEGDQEVNDSKIPKPKKAEKKKEKVAKATKSPKVAKQPKPKAPGKKRTKGEGKKDQALKLMLRKSGVTSAELNEKLGWKDTSVTMLAQWVDLVTRNGVQSFEVTKNATGEKVYRAA